MSTKLEKIKNCLLLHDAEIIDNPDNLSFTLRCICGSEEIWYRDMFRLLDGDRRKIPQWLELRDPFWIVTVGPAHSLSSCVIHLVCARTQKDAIERVFGGPPPAEVDYDVFLPDVVMD